MDIAKWFDNAELYSISQVLKENEALFEDDCIGIIFPCYNFAASRMVCEFIERIQLVSQYIFVIVTYSNTALMCASTELYEHFLMSTYHLVGVFWKINP
ncbi:TPA: hypothetical protein PNM72_000509 [Listeria monocytogenes]|uniref:Uncharacterized protein n=1 Tax=Listeria monocytogenes TaxID=1639 RepID=A0A9P1Y329_LISMN|nr:hypothetical protein [Listeria monocytogenes]EAE3750599.1 hypothetical protein [Listeria monocytogenes serotype 1/2a]EAG6255120.1 hypothetical protein [Listeria monocytogenes CFSAN003807]EAG6361352.1 hypothetical protein [Listeria monocytogenes CFSAN002351]ADB67585.1 hypothetical protein LM5578_0831 [Listeria monocytogenes 08-5578]ADB70630.1 hypothetical protein LM5923_0786 [Listeria monocytogenes 08-5923]